MSKVPVRLRLWFISRALRGALIGSIKALHQASRNGISPGDTIELHVTIKADIDDAEGRKMEVRRHV
jgi:hypothetical protein